MRTPTSTSTPTAEREVSTSAADLNTLDEVALLALRGALYDEELSVAASLPQADAQRDAAYQAGADGATIDQHRVVRARIAARQTQLVEEQQLVEAALKARLEPLVEAAHAEARKLADDFRREAGDLLDRLEGSTAAIIRDSEALAAMPVRASQAQAQYLAALGELDAQPANDIRWTVRLDQGRLWETAVDVRQGTSTGRQIVESVRVMMVIAKALVAGLREISTLRTETIASTNLDVDQKLNAALRLADATTNLVEFASGLLKEGPTPGAVTVPALSPDTIDIPGEDDDAEGEEEDPQNPSKPNVGGGKPVRARTTKDDAGSGSAWRGRQGSRALARRESTIARPCGGFARAHGRRHCGR
jgi:hypothetical protein